jgi:8-oxo-dGTP diphosphatase
MKEHQEYCLGFCFSKDKAKIVLILKNRPDFQRGKLNSVGGKLEINEFPHEAMVREFKEETGVQTNYEDWNYFASMDFENGRIYCYTIIQDLEVKTVTDEPVGWFDLNALPDNYMPNLSWLIPLALDYYREEKDVYIDYGK